MNSLLAITVVIISPEDNTGTIIGAVFGAIAGVLLLGAIAVLVIVIMMKMRAQPEVKRNTARSTSILNEYTNTELLFTFYKNPYDYAVCTK